jgi:DNA-binding response OmpR family regulator
MLHATLTPLPGLTPLSDLTPPSEARDPPRRPCVVLVDDHDATRAALARLLTLSGYLVFTAGTVAEAGRVVRDHGCDLLVADLELPDGSGLDLVRELSRSHGPGFRALAVTGFAEAGDRAACLEAGFAAFLAKPVAFDVLLDEVRALLSAAAA